MKAGETYFDYCGLLLAVEGKCKDCNYYGGEKGYRCNNEGPVCCDNGLIFKRIEQFKNSLTFKGVRKNCIDRPICEGCPFDTEDNECPFIDSNGHYPDNEKWMHGYFTGKGDEK